MNEFDFGDLEKQIGEKMKKEIEKDLQIRIEELLNSIMDELERSYELNSDLKINLRCTEGERRRFIWAIRKQTILELVKKGYMNEKFWKSKTGNF